MSTWNLIVIVAGLLLLIFICRKEFVRANKARLLWRMLASVLAVVCLVCMGLPITFTSNTVSGNAAIVITDGADQDSVQRFRKDRTFAVYHTDEFFLGEHSLYDSLHVFGYGFSDEELQSLSGSKIIFHPSSIANGIVSADWNRTIEKGKELLIQGVYKNATGSPVTLLLNGFDTILDSLTVPAKQEVNFRLRTLPKQNGKAIYYLAALRQKDILEKEPIPVEVTTPVSVKVLMLAASPDFENRFLKDWLSQNGYTVLVKTAISANKFDKTILNAGTVSLDRLTTHLLDSVDVVISDETALLSLSKPEQENVYSHVVRKGMGLIIRSDTIHLSKEWYAAAFQLYALQGKQPSQVSIHMMNEDRSPAVLPVEQPLFVRYRNGMQPFALDSANSIVAGIVAEGSGKIALTTLTNTYSWMLVGNTGSYAALWSGLLQKTARQKIPSTWIGTSTPLPVEQETVHITSITNENTLPSVVIDGKKTALAQNKNLSDHWQGTWWPAKAGWQTGMASGSMSNNWYVYGKHDWKYVKAKKKIDATGEYTQNTNNLLQNEPVAANPLPVPVHLFYFFLPFIICCGFLWLERKIF